MMNLSTSSVAPRRSELLYGPLQMLSESPPLPLQATIVNVRINITLKYFDEAEKESKYF